MSIRGVVVDASDTLLSRSSPVNGIDDLWDLCQRRDLQIIVTSNQPQELRRLRDAGYTADYEACPANIGIKKPSPKFITVPAAELGLQANELVYIGDNDKTDAFCAARAKVPYLRAEWAIPHGRDGKYGIPIPTLSGAARYIDTFLIKEHPWFWTVDGRDRLDRQFTYRAVIDTRTTDPAQERIKSAAVDVLKYNRHHRREFFLHHLFTSLYLSGVSESRDIWTTYPGHEQGSQGHDVLAEFIEKVSLQFHDKYVPLLFRHTEAPSNRDTRNSGRDPSFETQVQTVMLDPGCRNTLSGRRVLVLDDFTTGSNSFEWARNLLLAAGASDVICVAMGKFGASLRTVTPKPGISFDPFTPVALVNRDFDFSYQMSHMRSASNGELQDSFVQFEQSSPWAI